MAGTDKNQVESRFVFPKKVDFVSAPGRAINRDFLGDEERIVRSLADAARLDSQTSAAIQKTAARLVRAVR